MIDVQSVLVSTRDHVSDQVAISLIMPRGRARRRIRLCHFSTLFDIVAQVAIVSFKNTARWTPIANNLQEFFVHAVLSLDS